MSKRTQDKHDVDITKLSVNAFRQRMFVKRSEKLFGEVKSPYTYPDTLPEQVEDLEGMEAWESFSETWDIYWVGLDPRTMSWVAGRHNSPIRKLVLPLRIIPIDQRTGRMQETYLDRAEVQKIKVPNRPMEETEQDRIISESLSGKVVIDEPDQDKALRAIEANINMLQQQLLALKK